MNKSYLLSIDAEPPKNLTQHRYLTEYMTLAVRYAVRYSLDDYQSLPQYTACVNRIFVNLSPIDLSDDAPPDTGGYVFRTDFVSPYEIIKEHVGQCLSAFLLGFTGQTSINFSVSFVTHNTVVLMAAIYKD